MKNIFPSLTNSNPLTWKCKFFGCRNEKHSWMAHEDGEKHAIKFGKFTATKTERIFSFLGCRWCQNWEKVFEKEINVFPMWTCYCDKCNLIE